jgi:hypothetical protein
VSQSFGYIPKSGIAGSYGRSMFSFLSSLQIFFSRVVVLVYIPTSSVGSGPFPLSCGVFLPLPLLQALPLLFVGCVCCCSCLLLPGLFIYSSMWDFPFPHLQRSGHPALFATCLYCCYCLLFSIFSFFPWVGVDLSRGLC